MKAFKVNFCEKNLTGNAGLTHFGRFIKKLNLEGILTKRVDVGQNNPTYPVASILIILILGVIAGVKHMSQLEIPKNDKALRRIFNWDKFPVAGTFAGILKRFSFRSCNELSEAEAGVRRKVWGKKRFGKLTPDFYSSVKTVYGSREGAEAGYNPEKRAGKVTARSFALSIRPGSASMRSFVPATLTPPTDAMNPPRNVSPAFPKK